MAYHVEEFVSVGKHGVETCFVVMHDDEDEPVSGEMHETVEQAEEERQEILRGEV